MSGRRVVVTGIGTINPLGHNIEEYFQNLQDGVSAAAPITHFDASKFRSRIACEVKNYDWKLSSVCFHYFTGSLELFVITY